MKNKVNPRDQIPASKPYDYYDESDSFIIFYNKAFSDYCEQHDIVFYGGEQVDLTYSKEKQRFINSLDFALDGGCEQESIKTGWLKDRPDLLELLETD